LLGDDLRRFQRMVGDLLEMSRADAGSADVFLEEVNVSELVQRAVENGLRSLGVGAGGTDAGTGGGPGKSTFTPQLRIGPNVESLHVGVDKRRFERVMANLLENAANYGGGATVISVTTDEPEKPHEEAPIGGARIGLSGGIRHVGRNGGHGGRHGGGIGGRHGSGNGTGNGWGHGLANGSGRAAGGPANGAHDAHAMIQIGVEDAGPGISAAERAKVFDRFYRGSAAGRRGTGTGTGLGLALVAEHVRLMNGKTWVESSPSGGARFVISLPVLEADEGPTW
jgi:signal transduction histidine kinase